MGVLRAVLWHLGEVHATSTRRWTDELSAEAPSRSDTSRVLAGHLGPNSEWPVSLKTPLGFPRSTSLFPLSSPP